jgi:hypothetical protein
MKKLFLITLVFIASCSRPQLTPEQKQERMQRQMNWIYIQGLGK